MTCPRCGREIGEPGVLGRHYVVPAIAAMGCWGCQDDPWDAKLAAIEAECEANESKAVAEWAAWCKANYAAICMGSFAP